LPLASEKARPNLNARHGGHQSLVQVLHRLDEVGLAQDDVQVFRLLDGDYLEFHASILPVAQPPTGEALRV